MRAAGGRARLRRATAVAVLVVASVVAAAIDARAGAPVPDAGIRFAGKPPAVRSPLRALASWCGAGAETTTNRPDTSLSSANLIHVTYAVPSDGADRFGSLANGIKSDVDAIGAWWAKEDASRTPRFDLADFSGCSDVDLSVVRLPRTGASYMDPSQRLFQLASDLAALAPPAVKSLVYYDGPVPPALHFICGTSAGLGPQTGGSPSDFTFVWLGSDCPHDLGQGRVTAVVAAQETTHDLGAVMPGAPHGCPQSSGHVCESKLDLMYPQVFPDSSLSSTTLDTGRDDYYGFLAAGHASSSFDVETSGWLTHLPQFQLSVGHSGNGNVDVTGPGGTRACGDSCSLTLDNGTAVTLTAEPGPGSRLVAWQGSCAGSQPTCGVTADAAKSVTAQFGPARFAVKVGLSGKGRVTSSPGGISCPGRCRTTFAVSARLRARAARGYRFAGWAGACSGRGACRLVPGGDRSVRATFRRLDA